MESIGIFYVHYHVICKQWQFFFPIWIPFIIFFSCLITVARTHNTMLNRSGGSGQSCLVPDLSGKDFRFCPLSIRLAVGLSYMAFILSRNDLSIPSLRSVFIINGCSALWNAYFCIYWYDHVMFVFAFVYVMYYVYWFVDIVHPCITGMNPNWSWCMNYSEYCGMQFSNIFLRVLASMLMSNIGI